jgi:hypothetical protein
MSMSRIEIALWSAAVVCSAAAIAGARAPRVETNAEKISPRARVFSTASTMRDIEESALALAETDPFRAARHPSPIAYQPELEGAPPPPPRAPRPALTVSGIIGGPPWSAVLEGVPGREGGAVVRQGDTLGGLKVRAVKRDTVTISGVDTTWRLIVRRAW